MKKKNPPKVKKKEDIKKPVKTKSVNVISKKIIETPLSEKKPENIRKAAKMILAVGEENAVEILKRLDHESVELVVSEMIRLKSITDDEKVIILRDFKKNLDNLNTTDYGGIGQAQKFLEKTLGQENAQKHIDRVKKNINDSDFREIEKYPPENVAIILGGELAQTTAILLASIDSAFAAKIFKHLPNEYRVSVSRRIAGMSRVMPEVVRIAYQSVIQKLKRLDKSDMNVIEGENRLIEIFNHMDRSVEDKILENLELNDPEMSSRIREKLRVFEDILQLTVKEIRKIFDLVPDHMVWAKSLKGAGQNMIQHVFSSVSMNRASDIMTEMNFIEKISLKEIESNRRIIMDAINRLEKEGVLTLRKNKDEMVE